MMPDFLPADGKIDLTERLLLERVVRRGTEALDGHGIRLTVRNDFSALKAINRTLVEKGLWYPLIPPFDSDVSEIDESNAVWIEGTDRSGRTVTIHAARHFDWTGALMAAVIGAAYHGKTASKHTCTASSALARRITGHVALCGSLWFDPAYRGKGLSKIIPRLTRAYARSTWDIDWPFAIVKPESVSSGLWRSYGWTQADGYVNLDDPAFGDLMVVCLPPDDMAEDFRTHAAA